MIRYSSTRGDKRRHTFSEVVRRGMASDGGLFVPEKIPSISLGLLKELSKKSYQERAQVILELFEPDVSRKVLHKLVRKAYSSNFDTPLIAPAVHLKDNQYIAELWHGPTAAFKDMALQIMPLFFAEAVKKSGKRLHYLICVATSGDTGKAALEGYRDAQNVSILVLFPKGRVSKLQELQMKTQEGSNVGVLAVDGDFDTVQQLVKDVFNNRPFNTQLRLHYETALTSANSINWGRLVPQIIYHVNSYLDLIDQGVIPFEKYVDIAVPTGNFGNILAAFYARNMGLPVRKLLCASNENNVLTQFLRTGIYDSKDRTLRKTPSPSMDILIASNIERLLYEITKDPVNVSLWMNDLQTKKWFEVDHATKRVFKEYFVADWVSNQDCLNNIKKVYGETKYLMDPHTSVAQLVAARYIKQKSVTTPVIICGTAHWSKFPQDIYKALTGKSHELGEFEAIKTVCRLTGQSYLPESIRTLSNKVVRFQESCPADKKILENHITSFLDTQYN